MQIFGDRISGNCLKVKYVADHLGLNYDWVDVDILSGGSRTPEFLARSPQGQVPVVELDDGRVLAQSNAIMGYLATGSSLLPAEPFVQAKIYEQLFWEQYSHEPYVAVCRFQMLYQQRSAEEREAWRVERGEAALDHLEQQLNDRTWLVGDDLTIADIGLLAYTRVAHEGGFDLNLRPNVLGWVRRCEEHLHLS